MNVNSFVLDNGLKVEHIYMPVMQSVAVNVMYKVGSANEDENFTGIAHLMEHTMFTGSKNIPKYDTPSEKAGATNNAYTCRDYTNYYIILPYENVETGFWLESDRMRDLSFDEEGFNTQRSVVLEEFKQNFINVPYGDAYALLSQVMFKTSPYKWQTIGLNDNGIKTVTIDQMKNFYDKFYTPTNAVLSVVGNITFDKVKYLSEKWFGDIKSTPQPIQSIASEDPQTEARRLTVKKNVPNDLLLIGLKAPKRFDNDFAMSDLLSDILGNGGSSVFLSKLVNEQRIFESLDACVGAGIYEGEFHIIGFPSNGVSAQEAENAIWNELDKLSNNYINELELEKVKNKYEAAKYMSLVEPNRIADEVAFYTLWDKSELFNNELKKYRNINAEDMRNTAQKIFRREQSSTLWYLSEDSDRCPE